MPRRRMRGGNMQRRNEGVGMKYYSGSHKILLVGEGDFSFASSLATGFGNANNIVATSLDEADDCAQNYRDALQNTNNIQNRGGLVIHGIDIRRLCEYEALMNMKFDRIVFNFPHSGFEGRGKKKSVIRENANLVKCFIENAESFLLPGGEVHISQKVSMPYKRWRIPFIETENLSCRSSCRFVLSDHPGYNVKCGSGSNMDESFNSEGARTYIFSWKRVDRR